MHKQAGNFTGKKKAFLAAFAETGQIGKSALAAQIDRTQIYRWLKFEAFKLAFDQAEALAVSALEDEALRRAHEGVLDPVFYKGKPCGAVREYSDQLLIFMLKSKRPDKYRDRGSIELTGAGGGPVEIVSRLNAARARLKAAKKE